MSGSLQFVAFPLILPWREDFWGLPLYFPELTVGVLWHWPPGLPYQGRPLPPQVETGLKELRHYAPGDLTQWQAYEKYTDTREEVDDILRALRGELEPEAEKLKGPWQTDDVYAVAWQLELAEADQEAHLNRVERGGEWLAEMFAPEPWEEPGALPALPGEPEILDPETARWRYLLWRREMAASLAAGAVPLLLGRTSRAIFTYLRGEAGLWAIPAARLRLPGCRTESEYLALRGEEGFPAWQPQFRERLAPCLAAAVQGADLGAPVGELSRWVEEELLKLWPLEPDWFTDLEIWRRAPEAPEGGEPLVLWGRPGRELVAG